MSYVKFNVLTELRVMAAGRKPKVQPWMIALSALTLIEDVRVEDEIEQLERLYELPDPR